MEKFELSIEDLTNDVCASVKEDLMKVLDIWKNMGLNVGQLQERWKIVIKQLSNVAKNMLEEEKRHEAKVSKKCSDHMATIAAVWTELQCEGEFMVDDGFENFSLLMKEKYLREHVDLLRKEKLRRIEEEKWLRKEEADLSAVLGVDCVKVKENILFTDKERMYIENHIEEMKMMKEERENNILKIREEIAGVMEQLEMDINTASLTDIIMVDESKSLTLDDIASVQRILDELKKKLKDRQTNTEMLVKEINKLYDKLKVQSAERLPLAMGHVCRTEDLYKNQYRSDLEAEITKLKVEKKKKIQALVEDGKIELNELWGKCFVSEEDRGEFARRTIGNSEHAFDEIENEIEKLKIYYNSNYEMLIKYKKLISLWATVEDLDIKSRDPNRLFKSRGNTLFKEERERKQVALSLPKIEQELYAMAEEHLAESGQVLIVGRISLVDLIKTLRVRHSQQLKNISVDLKVASKSMNATAFNNNATNKTKSLLGKPKTPQPLAFLSSPRRPRNSPIARNLHRATTHHVYSPAKTKFQVPKIQINFDITKDFGLPDASSTFIGSNPTCGSNYITCEGVDIKKTKEYLGGKDLSVTESILISKNDSTLSPHDESATSDEEAETTVRQKKKRFGFNFKKANLGGRCAAGRKAMKLNSVLSSAAVGRWDGQALPRNTNCVTGLLQGASNGSKEKGGRNFSIMKKDAHLETKDEEGANTASFKHKLV